MRARILFLLLAIAASAAVAQAQPVISFETNAIAVTGGYSIALLAEAAGSGPAGPRTIIGVKNPDPDGIVRFPIPKTTVMNAIAVDTGTGMIGVASVGISPQTLPLPGGLILQGPSAWSRLVLPDSVTRFLWIRPGSGAWGAVTSTLTDEDSTPGNGVRFTQVSSLGTFQSSGFTPPTGFQNGDLFIALGGTSMRMSGTVDAQLGAGNAGALSFASASSVFLGEGGSREIVLMRTQGAGGTASVRLRTVPGSATPGVDYTALNQIATFEHGDVIKKFTLNSIDDDTYSSQVSLTLELLDASGASITGGATRGVDIATNDPAPTIGFGNVPATVAEQNAPWTLNVPVVLTGKTRAAATANYAILRDGLAGPTGSVTIPAGQTTANIPLNIPGNTTPEANYQFTMYLSPGMHSTIGTPSNTNITVTNDDAPATLSVADVSVLETNSAGSSATFVIALSQAMSQEVRVSYATANLEATAGSDFVAKSGVAIFPPGQTNMLIHVEILGDTVPESDEKFRFILSDPVGATISRAVAEGTIRDDDRSDAAPMLSVSASTVIEKTGSNSDAAFRINLTPSQAQEVRVSFATADSVGATAGSDYIATNGIATFALGETSKVIIVPVIGDSAVEPNETFKLVLSSPAGAGITAPGHAEITIIDDDLPQVTASDMSVSESTPLAVLTLRVTPPVNRAATVAWTTANGTATGGQDFVAGGGSLTFPETANVHIQILPDSLLESNETFYVDFTSVTNATLERQRVAITILDDDQVTPGRIMVSDTSVIETTGADGTATFQVTLVSPVSSEVRVAYATADGTAFSGSDYGSKSGTLVFAPGQVSATVPVPIFGDALAEADETFRLTLSNPVNAAIGRASGEATIQDDDSGSRPSLSIEPVRVIEGTGPNTDSVFAVTLSAASTTEVRVDFATANDNALEGVDYVATNGTLVFAPGEVSKTIVVPVFGDSIAEPQERFTVSLTNASGALIAAGVATGTIVDDDVTRRRAARH